MTLPALGARIIALAVLGSFLAVGFGAQRQLPAADLVRKLQVESSTDDAAKQLVQLAKTDRGARDYLVAHLPAIVERNPYENPRPWTNAVKLAGELKITEAVPALAKWIGIDDMESNALTMAEIMRLELNPAAKALAQIGDPAVPAVSQVLEGGNRKEKRYAVYVLVQIHSPAATQALAEDADHESDLPLKRLIDRIVARNTQK